MDDLVNLRARYDANRRKVIRIISNLAFAGAEPAAHGSVSRLCRYAKGAPPRASETKEEQMNTKRFLLAGCATIILSAGAAQAGSCDTAGKDVSEHPPTSTMNRAAGNVATSSQDVQKQMQGQPTAAQQAQGVEPSAQSADKRLLNTRTNGFGQARSTVSPSAASTEAVRYFGSTCRAPAIG